MSGHMTFLYSMPAGVAGALSRPNEAVVEPQIYDAGNAPAAFGLAVVMGNGKVRLPLTTSTGEDVYGFTVRVWPGIGGNLEQGFEDGAPNVTEPASIMTRGYMTVRCQAGTPVKGGQVHVRVQSPSSGKPLGGVEAAADGANTVAVPHCIFTGGMDAHNNTEIRLWR